MHYRKLLALACTTGATLSPLACQPALAQSTSSESNRLNEVIVTSSRIATPLRQIGTSVSVLNSDDLNARSNDSLLDILRTLPAVAVSNNGGQGQITTMRIRGEEGYRTLTLLDGMKLSDPSVTQVQPQLEHLLSSGIERVEILRGPQGLSYGADAGGVVNISTRRSTNELRSTVDVLSGAFGTRQLNGNVSAGNDLGDFFVSASQLETDGFNTRKADTVTADDDGYDNTSLHARVSVNARENLRLELVHRDVTGESAYDGCFHPTNYSQVHDCDVDFEQQASRASATYEGATGTQSLAYARTATERGYFTLGAPAYDFTGKTQRWEYLGTATGFDTFNLVYGADLEEENNHGDTRDQRGYYIEYLSDFSDALFLTAGARRDDSDDFGDHNSYRISSAYLIGMQNNAELKLRASMGTGFRAPSPYEAAYNRGPSAQPPASLVSLTEETSAGYELAVEYYTPAGLHLEAVYFDQKIEDAIQFDLNAYSGYLQDVGKSTSEGVELSANLPLTAQLTLNSNYTYNEALRPDGSQRFLRPKHLANLGLSWQSADERLHLSGFYRRSQDTIDSLLGSAVALEDYDVVDLSASFDLSRILNVYARIDNATDADYEEVLGYNTAGRSVYVGIRANF
ncbi:MAG: TonB-dependent receptor [Gammaproteobacteria bacterium]|nr:TonB-dependent receptor [Gammaproteobacteria bacterium]